MAETMASVLGDLEAAAEGDQAVAALVLAMELYPEAGYEVRDLDYVRDRLPVRARKKCEYGDECTACAA